MGREIRRVPAGWEHPTQRCPHSLWAGGCHVAKQNGGQCFKPLHDKDFETEARQWLDAAIAWDNGTDPDTVKHKAEHPFYWMWDGEPPDPKYYRPKWTDEERTHFQMYETVSEGTPVSPVFATKEELVEHLVKYGDSCGDGVGWQREHAVAFVKNEFAPSMIIADGVVYKPEDGIPDVMRKK